MYSHISSDCCECNCVYKLNSNHTFAGRNITEFQFDITIDCVAEWPLVIRVGIRVSAVVLDVLQAGSVAVPEVGEIPDVGVRMTVWTVRTPRLTLSPKQCSIRCSVVVCSIFSLQTFVAELVVVRIRCKQQAMIRCIKSSCSHHLTHSLASMLVAG